MSGALTPAQALQLFLNSLPPDTRVGVAVSGGGDSMALLHMLAHAPCMVCACSVHHHLRPEADAEVASVAAFCAAHDIAHEVVDWHWDGQGNLQDQARRGRYALLSDWATRNDLAHVALGHTADDNIETLLMGLSRGAGLDGLSGMRPWFIGSGVTFHRPLLAIRRAALRDLLRQAGVAWHDDPSNDDPSYHRIRLRQAMDSFEGLGLTPDMLLKTIGNLRATREGLETALAQSARGHVRAIHGDLRIDRGWFDAAPIEYRRRILNACLCDIASRDYPPRAAKLTPLLSTPPAVSTLHGCLVMADPAALHVTREHSATEGPVASTALWDGRWRANGPHQDGTILRALGEDGIAQCPAGWRDLALPRASVLASPSVWDGPNLLSAPMANWPNGWVISASSPPPAALASILSH